MKVSKHSECSGETNPPETELKIRRTFLENSSSAYKKPLLILY